MLRKLEKHKANLWSPLSSLAPSLGPSPGEQVGKSSGIKERYARHSDKGMRLGRRQRSRIQQQSLKKGCLKQRRKLAAKAMMKQVPWDEADDFHCVAQKAGRACDDIIAWWGAAGESRFPKLSLLARDALIA